MNEKIQSLIFDLQNIVAHIPNIESGGCALFAYHAAQVLLSHGHDAKVYYLNDADSPSLDKEKINQITNCDEIPNQYKWDLFGLECYHAMVFIDGYLFDNKHIMRCDNQEKIHKNKFLFEYAFLRPSKAEIPLDKLEIVSHKKDGWNDIFNRDIWQKEVIKQTKTLINTKLKLQ